MYLVDVAIVVGDVTSVGGDIGGVDLFNRPDVLVLNIRQNFSVLRPVNKKINCLRQSYFKP